MDVKPLLASVAVSNKDEVDWPFGRGKKVGVGGCFRRAVGRGKAHLGGSQGSENFHIVMREDVRRSPGGVIPFGQDEEA